MTVHCRAKLTPEESKNLVIPKSLIPESYGKDDATPFRIDVKHGSNVLPVEMKDRSARLHTRSPIAL